MTKNTCSPNFNLKYDEKINNLHFLSDTFIISKNYEKVQSDGSISPPDSTKNYSNHSNNQKELSSYFRIHKKKFCVKYINSSPKNNIKNSLLDKKNNINNPYNSSKNLLSKKRKRDSKIFFIEKIKRTLIHERFFYRVNNNDENNNNNIKFEDKKITNKTNNINKNIKNNKKIKNNKNLYSNNVFDKKNTKKITNNLNGNKISKKNLISEINSDNLNNQNLNNQRTNNTNSENLNNDNINNIKIKTSNKQKEKLLEKDNITSKEEISSKYSDEQYEKDMEIVNNDKKLNFMKDNFPIMFQKDKYYLYTVIPKQKKENNNNYYIVSNFFQNCNKLNYNKSYDYLYENKKYIGNSILISNKNNEKNIFNIYKTLKKSKTNIYNILPKKVWSITNESIKINIDKFLDDCINIWDFNKCCFFKEIALEFLMLNDYKPDSCFQKIDQFKIFMEMRAKELDFPILSNTDKIVKKYNLRKTNNK